VREGKEREKVCVFWCVGAQTAGRQREREREREREFRKE
jgi:hypothetical protein